MSEFPYCVPRRVSWLLALLTLMLAANPTFARFKMTVTKADAFDSAQLSKVLVVTSECHEVVDCAAVERKIATEVAKLDVAWKLVPERIVRELLLQNGHTSYTTELREWLVSETAANAVMELKIPHAEKGDGYGGQRGSQVKVELSLLTPSGGILMHAVGTGRPKNVVTGPERVAGNMVEDILREAFQT